MKNVASIFGKPVRRTIAYDKVDWPLPEQLIGIEIEVETLPGVVHPTNILPYWKKERDGSLRNGVEYILNQPQKGDTLSRAIAEIFAGSTFTRSTTGSTHVHIDMMEEGTNPNTIKLLVLLLYVLEPAVFALADAGREWCGYTNKLASAPDALLGAVLNDEPEYESLRLLCSDGYRVGRYYGLNLLALQEHGSIEFRYFPTATSVDEVVEWVALVQSFKKAALEVDSVESLAHVFDDAEHYSSFLHNYFGRWKEQFASLVPHYQAAAALQKALAVAGSYIHINTTQHVGWDERAVTGNTIYSKFLKKQPEKKSTASSGTLHIIGDHNRLPSNETVVNGDPMLYAGCVYYWQGRWIIWNEYGPTLNETPVEYRAARRRAMNTLRAHHTSIPRLCEQAEMIPRHMTSCLNLTNRFLSSTGESL